MILTVDDVRDQKRNRIINNPCWSQIENAISELDGDERTLVTLGEEGHICMSIGGGGKQKGMEKRIYVVSVIGSGGVFSIVDMEQPDTTETLVVGRKEGTYQSKICVNLLTALVAARTFSQHEKMDSLFPWTLTDSLFPWGSNQA